MVAVLAAALHFLVCLLPLVGPFALYTLRYSSVADHHQYLACIGPIARFAAGLHGFLRGNPAGRAFHAGVCGALLASCGVLTWQQTEICRDDVTLWRDTLAKNPSSWFARNNLAHGLHQQGDVDGALHAVESRLR